MRNGRVIAALAVVLAIAPFAVRPASAQSAVDGFDPGANVEVLALALQADGRIVVGGAFTMLGGGGTGVTPRSRIGRLNASGSLDMTFDPGANGPITSIVVQPDGRILVAGTFTLIGGGGSGSTARQNLARLNPDGTVDATFNPGANGTVSALALQSDGRILLGGDFTMLGGGGTGTTPRSHLGRLHPDASIDASFDPGANNTVSAIALQANGQILVGGSFVALGGGTGTTTRNHLGRLNPDGSLDSGFNPGASGLVYALAVLANGQVVVGGEFTLLGGGTGTTPRSRIGRINPDGSLDATFDPGANSTVVTLAVQANAQILVGGAFTMLGGGGAGTTPRSQIGRLNPDGSLDASFDPGTSSTVVALAQQPDGQILVGGNFTMIGGGAAGSTARSHIGRLHPDGRPDRTFDPGANSSVFAVAMQADGKMVVGGEFTALGDGTGTTPRRFVGRLHLDGSVDAGFDPGANGPVFAVAVQADGKLLVAGDFTTLGGGGSGSVTRNYIGRLNPDGSLDAAFNPGADAPIRALALQADGRILVGGFFSGLGGGTGSTTRNGIGRLNVDGSVDPGFNPGANGDVWTVAVQPDERILVGGAFTMLGGGTGTTPRSFIGRLNADGSVDTGFNPGANSFVYTLAVQTDGRILCGGFFTALGGGGTGTAGRHRIGRLNADGSVDPTFNPGANNTVLTLALQADGGVVAGGAFTTMGGGGTGNTSRFRIARLLPDGTVDPSYNPGANDAVYALAVQRDGRVAAGGAFTLLGGGFAGTAVRKRIGRLTSTGAPVDAVRWMPGDLVMWSRAGGAPEIARAAFDYSTDGVAYTPLGSASRVAGGWALAEATVPVNQLILIRGRGQSASGILNGSGSVVESIGAAYVACPGVLPASLPPATLGVPYAATFTATGAVGAVTFVLTGALPGGLTFTNGVIAGTPTQTGAFSVTVTATDGQSGCVGTRDVTLTVSFPAGDVTAFDPGANGDVWAIAVQPDGKIIVGGGFTTLGGGGTGTTPRSFLARLNANGSLDTAFDPGADGFVRAIALQPDGRIVVAGSFTMVGGGGTGTTARDRIARLNPDGSLDTGFDPGANNTVHALAVQADGGILVGGDFTLLGGGGRGRIGRLDANGVLDPAFDPGADASVLTLAEQADGRILVGGDFSKLGGGGFGVTTRNYLGRLNANGTIDAGFDPGADFIVYALATQADGRVLAGGEFSGLGGGTGTTARSFIGRLNADGSVDMTFDPGANDLVWSLSVQADGRILVGGCFSLLGGGGVGTAARRGIGRLDADGAADASFNPGSDGCVYGIAPEADGRIIAGGGFTALGGGTGTTPRSGIGELPNPDPATDMLTFAAGGSTVTWSRGGGAPEVLRTTFEASTDGTTFTALGGGSRVPGGWTVTGLNLPADPNLRVRARGYHASGTWNGSGSIVETEAPAPGNNMIENGTFGSGTTGWSLFATPDPTYIVSNVAGGVLQFYRVAPPPGTSNQAVVFQNTGLPLAAFAPLEALFDLGNTSGARKRISVLIHDADFSDLSVCTFWLAPNTPLQTYTMRMHTTEAWTDSTISFYAATIGSDGGFSLLDNISMQHSPAGATDRTDCVDPTAPSPPGGAAGPTVLGNGDFSSATLAPWGVFGTITWRLQSGRFEFYRPAGLPAGVVLQQSGAPVAQNQILTATLDLGNSSLVRKRVTVLLHDADFSDLAACTFWLPPQSPLATYRVRTFATEAWSSATVSVYPSTIGLESWIGLDDVSLRQTPGDATLGTECLEPGSGAVLPAPGVSARRAKSPEATRATRNGRHGPDHVRDLAARSSGPQGFVWPDEIDLRGASAVLSFESWQSGGPSPAEVQVSVDGVTWTRLIEVPVSDDWISLDVDLGDYAGWIIRIRFVFDGNGLDTWFIRRIAVHSGGRPPPAGEARTTIIGNR